MSSELIRKIQALLSKAESTEFEAEAEAFNAKAAQLMAEYAITAAQLQVEAKNDVLIEVRSIIVPNPYSVERVSLLVSVAKALGGDAFYYKQRRDGHKTRNNIRDHRTHGAIVGLPEDLDLIEAIFSSISDQCDKFRTSSLKAEERVRIMGLGDKKVFSATFMRSYASRIHHRLREAYDTTISEASESVALVLRDKREMIDEKMSEMNLGKSKSQRKTDWAGLQAGRSAADRTQIQKELR